MLTIQTYKPEKLSPFIKSFWYLKVSQSLGQPYIEEILPDGHHEIIFHLNSTPSRKRAGDKTWTIDHPVFFTGQNRKSYKHQFEPGAIIYGIRFHPHTQALFYDFPASLATDNQIALSDVSANDILADCISEFPEKTFVSLEKELLKKASRFKTPDNNFRYVEAAVRSIINQEGNIKIKSLEKLTGVSSRYLEKSFQKFVGLSPKQFSNIIRYGHFINYRKNNPDKNLTQCAYETGFYDQSHLIYLANLISNQSPKTYFNKLNYINDFFL